jgi:pyruvate,water dikinase
VAVVVQRMVNPETAGVLFTRNPVSGADERVVEASWGLGESVVAGLVTPDRWRFRRGGEIVDHAPGDKDLEILPGEGGTEERPVDPARARRACLEEFHLRALEELASRCESHFEGPSDLEWAFARETEGPETLYLLQRRPVTR